MSCQRLRWRRSNPVCSFDRPAGRKGSLRGEGLRFACVVASFNDIVTGPLLSGALEALERHGVDISADVEVAWVPGSFELPLIAKQMALSKKFDAIICVGAVVKL